jgi:hypothetical protein
MKPISGCPKKKLLPGKRSLVNLITQPATEGIYNPFGMKLESVHV